MFLNNCQRERGQQFKQREPRGGPTGVQIVNFGHNGWASLAALVALMVFLEPCPILVALIVFLEPCLSESVFVG